MRTHEYIEFFQGEIAIRKNLETGKYQVVENIPDYKIIVWSDHGNTEQDLKNARAKVKALTKYANI